MYSSEEKQEKSGQDAGRERTQERGEGQVTKYSEGKL